MIRDVEIRDKVPAEGKFTIKKFDEKGNLSCMKLYMDGKLHADKEPAVVHLDKETGMTTMQKFYFGGRLHRIGKPAVMYSDGVNPIREEYWEDGVLTRLHGLPAVTCWHPGTGIVVREEYWVNNVQHCEGAPALVVSHHETGVVTLEMWCCRSMIHREGNKPAVTYRDPITGLVTEDKYFIKNTCLRMK